MAIEYKKSIKFTKDSTIYGHTGLDEAGFPVGAGNGKLSQVLDMAEVQTIENLKAGITITIDPDNSLLYHFNIDGVSVASFEVPPDKFLKSVQFNESTKILSFVFVTESGTESTIPVNLSSLIDTYKAGNGLLLSSGYFSIKLKSGETRIKVTSDGLSFDASDIIEKIDTETQRATNAETGLANRMTTVETEFNNLSDDLEAKAVRAESAATNASNSATTATQQATVATEKASQAGNSASRASASEANASTYAGNAQASANTAKEYAEQAQTLLEEAELNVITSIEQTVTSTEPSGKNTVTITQKNGKKSEFNVYNGAQGTKGDPGTPGVKGDPGARGVSVQSVVQTTTSTESSGQNVITVTLSDSTASTFSVRNGAKGAKGDKGDVGTISASDVLTMVYPVGSIYMSVSSTSPASFLGGTWERIQDKFLLSAGSSYSAGSTGGEASHTLTEAEMPSHSHTRGTMEITGEIFNKAGDTYFLRGFDNEWTKSGALSTITSNSSKTIDFATGSSTARAKGIKLTASKGWTGSTSSVGSGSAHNNMPPYLAVYVWKRTA